MLIRYTEKQHWGDFKLIDFEHDDINYKLIIVWINLFIGLYNIYSYVNSDWLFNLIIGILNIGVWVFNRKIQRGMEMINVSTNANGFIYTDFNIIS